MSSDAVLQQRRSTALDKLQAKHQKMSEHLRNLPSIPLPGTTELLSYTDAIREVTNLTDKGKKIIDSLVP